MNLVAIVLPKTIAIHLKRVSDKVWAIGIHPGPLIPKYHIEGEGENKASQVLKSANDDWLS